MVLKTGVKSLIKKIIAMKKEEIIKPIIIPTPCDKLLEGKIALIIGGSSGIGLAIAETFMKSGAKIIIAGSNEKRLLNAIDNLQVRGGIVKGLIIDIKNVKILPQKIKEASQMYEEARIDILVNSAGINSKHDFWGTDEEEYDMIMDINAKGTFFTSKTVAKFMIEHGIRGHILNVTSSSALRPAWTPYQMSKWAVRGFTEGLADIVLPYGIIVNAIAPGPTATGMMGKKTGDSIYKADSLYGRYAMPEEIASLAVFLVSGAGDMVVGDTFNITGGSGIITMHR